MASTRDHVAAYDYESRRRVTSLVLGADEAGLDPRRRLNRTLVGSIVVAVLAMAGFGVAGLLGGGSGPGLPDSGAVLVKGQGDRYVVVDGVVHPALNLTSALLVGGGTLTEVRPDALDGKPRGLPVGIPDVPDALPSPDRLSRGAWTVCMLPSDSQVVASAVTVLVGLPAPTQGVLDPTQAVVVPEGKGVTWMVAQGRRYLLTGITATLLGLQGGRPVAVPPQVLDTIPQGPDVAVPHVDQGGSPSVSLPVSASTGDLIRTQVAGQKAEYFLVRQDGISQLTQFTFTLLAGSGLHVVNSDPATIAKAPVSTRPAPGERGWPQVVPNPIDAQRGQPLCVSTTPGQPAGDAPWNATVSVPPSMPAPDGVAPVTAKNGDLPGVVTSVLVAPGSGALVFATSTSGQDGTYTLVTDSGQRFPAVDQETVNRLHYDPNQAVHLPVQFVSLLPAGPVLDPDAAAKEFPGQASPQGSATPTPSPSPSATP